MAEKELWKIVSATLIAELEDNWEEKLVDLPFSCEDNPGELKNSKGYIEQYLTPGKLDFFSLKDAVKEVIKDYTDPNDENLPRIDIDGDTRDDALLIEISFYATRTLKKATPEQILMFDNGDLPLFYVRIQLSVEKMALTYRIPTVEEAWAELK